MHFPVMLIQVLHTAVTVLDLACKICCDKEHLSDLLLCNQEKYKVKTAAEHQHGDALIWSNLAFNSLTYYGIQIRERTKINIDQKNP